MSVISRPLLVPINRDLHIPHIFLPRLGFSSVSRSKDRDLVFSATYLWGSFAHLPASGGISPTDTLRKDSALTPVTSEKSTPFSWVTRIVRLCKDLKSGLWRYFQAIRRDGKYLHYFLLCTGIKWILFFTQPTTNNYQRTPRNFSEVYKIRFEIFGRYAI